MTSLKARDQNGAQADAATGDDIGPAVTKRSYFPGFDGIRAIAVGLVLVAHAGYGDKVPGGLGVTVFFAISGFLITSLLLNEADASGTVNLKLFYIRRFLRLFPELLFFVLVTMLLGAALEWRATVIEKAAVIFYFFNYYYVFGQHYFYLDNVSYPWRQIWSLAVEEHFYFLFPTIVLLFHRRRDILLKVLVALLVLPFLWRFVTYFAIGLPWEYNYVATDTRIDSIVWGCLLAVMLRSWQGGAGAPERSGRPPFLHPALFALGLALMIFSLLYRSEDFRWTWRFTVQGVALFLIFANLLFDPRWKRLVAILEHPVPRYFGRISYSLYLYHMLVNRLLLYVLPETSRFYPVIALSISVVVASASYRLLEVPLKPLRRRFGSHVR